MTKEYITIETPEIDSNGIVTFETEQKISIKIDCRKLEKLTGMVICVASENDLPPDYINTLKTVSENVLGTCWDLDSGKGLIILFLNKLTLGSPQRITERIVGTLAHETKHLIKTERQRDFFHPSRFFFGPC